MIAEQKMENDICLMMLRNTRSIEQHRKTMFCITVNPGEAIYAKKSSKEIRLENSGNA